jgi:L-fuculose-phosphate aldolase
MTRSGEPTDGPYPLRGATLHFTPSPEAEVALLCRILHREGYSEKHYGHISYAQDDGTILFTAWEKPWSETAASDILRVDGHGELVEGRWSVTPAIELHLAIHRLRPEVRVAVHHHPRWATVWAAHGELPPPYCQTGSQVGRLGLYDEYDDSVADPRVAERNVRALDGFDAGLLANHGVLVFGSSPRRALERCVALETRCRVAWDVHALGGGRPMPEAAVQKMVAAIEGDLSGPRYHHAAIRREVLADPSVLM